MPGNIDGGEVTPCAWTFSGYALAEFAAAKAANWKRINFSRLSGRALLSPRSWPLAPTPQNWRHPPGGTTSANHVPPLTLRSIGDKTKGSNMPTYFSIRSESMIDRYNRQHTIDLSPDGRMHVLDTRREVAKTYERATWTLLVDPETHP